MGYNIHLNQFNGGEISPMLEGRFDLPKYTYSSRRLQNAVVLCEGMYSKRGGSHFAGTVKEINNESERVIIIPFTYSQNTAFEIMFGQNYIRFYANHGLVLDDNDDPYELVSPYTISDLYDENERMVKIQTIQCGDVLYIFHEDIPPMMLSRYGNTNWVLENWETLNGPWQKPNTDDELPLTASGTDGYVTLSAGDPPSSKNTFTVTPSSAICGGYRLYTGQHPYPGATDYIEWYVDGVKKAEKTGCLFVSLTEIIQQAVATLNNDSDFTNLIAGYDGSKITLTAKNSEWCGKVIKLKANYWTGTIIKRNGGIFADKYYLLNPNKVAYEISITIKDFTGVAIFTANDVGRLFRLTLKNDNTAAWYTEKTGIVTGQMIVSGNNYYQAQNDGTCGNVKPVHTDGIMSDGTILWKYVHSGYGVVKIVEVVDAKTARGNVQTHIPSGISTSYWERGLIGPGKKYPKAGAFYRNRMCFLIETGEGLQVEASCSSDYNNFADKTYGEVLAENAISAPVPADEKVSAAFLSAADVLFVGTSGGIFVFGPASSSEALSPSNAKIDIALKVGAKAIHPVQAGKVCLFVQNHGTNICGLSYSFESDSYTPSDISLLARHLFYPGVVSWAWQETPNKILWCVTGDGRLIGMTFNVEQQVIAFHQHSFSGWVESVSVIPSPESRRDDVWITVRRRIGDVDIRTIEWMDEGMVWDFPENIETIQDLDMREQEEIEYVKNNSFFVDSGVEWTRPIGNTTTELSGLAHLAGKVVAILADGAERPHQTVTASGGITVDSGWQKITVGLPIILIHKPQKIYPQLKDGGTFSPQKINGIILMLYRSGGAKIGGSYETLNPILFRKATAAMDTSTDLFTGCKAIPWGENSSTLEDKGANIIIYSDSVYPLNVLAVSFNMDV